MSLFSISQRRRLFLKVIGDTIITGWFQTWWNGACRCDGFLDTILWIWFVIMMVKARVHGIFNCIWVTLQVESWTKGIKWMIKWQGSSWLLFMLLISPLWLFFLTEWVKHIRAQFTAVRSFLFFFFSFPSLQVSSKAQISMQSVTVGRLLTAKHSELCWNFWTPSAASRAKRKGLCNR